MQGVPVEDYCRLHPEHAQAILALLAALPPRDNAQWVVLDDYPYLAPGSFVLVDLTAMGSAIGGWPEASPSAFLVGDESPPPFGSVSVSQRGYGPDPEAMREYAERDVANTYELWQRDLSAPRPSWWQRLVEWLRCWVGVG